MRWRQRRGFALLTMVGALLVVAVVMDRLAASLARDRSEAEAAAALTFIRSVSEAALFTNADPISAGVLPHISERRDLDFTYVVLPAGDRLRFAWPGMSAVTRTVLGNRLGEWLGRDRVTSPLELGLDEVPLPYPERVRRVVPSMTAPLETAGIRSTGTLEAAEGNWDAASTDTLTVTPPVVGEDSGVSASTLTVGASVTAPRLRSGTDMGVPDAVTLTITNPPAGEDALRLGTLTTDTLNVSTRLNSNQVTVTVPAPADADALARSAGVALDLRAATIIDITAGSVRARTTNVNSLEVRSRCVGCTP